MPELYFRWHVLTENGAPVLFSGGMYGHAAHAMVTIRSPSIGDQATMNTTRERGLSYQENNWWHWVNFNTHINVEGVQLNK